MSQSTPKQGGIRKYKTEEVMGAKAAANQRKLKEEFLKRQAKAEPPPRADSSTHRR